MNLKLYVEYRCSDLRPGCFTYRYILIANLRRELAATLGS
jgi:hypothetical protein